MTEPVIAHIEGGRHLYGGAQQVLYLLEGLQRQQIHNVLVCPEGAAIAEPARALGATVVEIRWTGDVDIGVVSRIRHVLKTERVTLVHCHSRRGADIFGGLAARLQRLPCVLSRRVDNPEPRGLVPLKYRLFDHVIAISEGIRQVLLSCGLPPAGVTTVRSAVDFEGFQHSPDHGALVRRFGLPDDAKVLGIAAQLIPRKGHQLLLSALPPVFERHPECRILIMGRGPLEREIHAEIVSADLGERVLMTGFLSDLPNVLPSLDGLVHPALAEGLGVILLQAAASGLPVIASRVGGMPEAVIDGETGWLIAPGDQSALTGAMMALLGDAEGARAKGEAGRALMRAQFSIEVMVAGNLAVYRRLLG